MVDREAADASNTEPNAERYSRADLLAALMVAFPTLSEQELHELITDCFARHTEDAR